MIRARTHRWLWLLLALAGCGGGDTGLPLPARQQAAPGPAGQTLVARIAHVTDTHVVDSLSPARFPGAYVVVPPAWRPQEAYATQLFDGIIRQVNRIHAAGRTIDFLVHTGDACDNVQSNELQWDLAVMDGGTVSPLSGPDDRPVDQRPDALHDPYATFQAQGLYESGRHGPRPSIPWYTVFGNHDVYAIGVFPIFESPSGHRTAPLPLPSRPGIVLPVVFDPLADFAYGNVTPAAPGPPELFELPRAVVPNAARAYFSKPEFIAALSGTRSGPFGHGLADAPPGATWYSLHPVPGLRLVGLDTTTAAAVVRGGINSEGALSRVQLDFLGAELTSADAAGELVVVATHHPSIALTALAGSEVTGEELRAVLRAHPSVVVHLAGHTHRNHVSDQGGYVEIETCSTLDLPQEGRVVEIWRSDADGSVTIAYDMFSHLDDSLPALGDDPLRELRAQAQALAMGDKSATARQRGFEWETSSPAGAPEDRAGTVTLELKARRAASQ